MRAQAAPEPPSISDQSPPSPPPPPAPSAQTPPSHAVPPTQLPPSPVTTSMAAFGGNESCPNCGARMATDQRYCLNCGHRRGDPRLPFMDAVVFMEAMSTPGGGGAAATPPPPPAKADGNNRWNANAALIAGVATLVLAIGVGFLIGRSGHENAPQAAAPQVIKVEGGTGGGSGEEAATGTTPEESTGGGSEKRGSKSKGAKKSAGKKSASEKSKIKEGSKEEEEIAKEETAKVLHSKEKLLEPKTQVGESCQEGVAGCTNGKFEGNFFE